MFSKLSSFVSNDPQPAKANDGASLTSVLDTPALRTELALLVLLCTDAMRSNLAATFDASQTNSSSSATASRKEAEAAAKKKDKQSWDWAAGEESQETQETSRPSDQTSHKAAISTRLTQFEDEKRVLILHCLLLLLLSLEHYPAHSRVLL